MPAGTRAILVLVLCSYFLIVLNNALMIVGLSEIRDEFAMTATELSWVQNCFTLAFGGVMLLGARLGDVWGRRTAFLLGLGVFSIASLLAGAAGSAPTLLAARALQGAGAGVLAPTTLALLTATFAAGQARTRAVAAYGSIAGVGGSVGLVAGGALTALASWRFGFFLDVPIGLILMVVAVRFVPRTPRVPERFDALGALLSLVGPVCVLYGIIRSVEFGWADILTIASFSSGLALIALFVLVEHRAAQPIMPLRLFADSGRSAAYVARMLFMGAIMGFTFYCSQFLQIVLGFDPLTAGLAFLPMTVVNFGVAIAVAPLTRRFGNSWLLVTGLSVTAAGMALLGLVSPQSEYLTGVFVPLLLVGVGQGLALAPLTVAGILGVAPADAGAGSGVVNVAHQIGGSLGLAVLVTVSAAIAGNAVTVDTLARQSSAAFVGAAIMLCAALVTVAVPSILNRRSARRRGRADTPETGTMLSPIRDAQTISHDPPTDPERTRP
ncbi:MFS transporter [Microbacterium forte]